MKQVEGHPGLVKDPRTQVVQNTNLNDLQRAKMARRRILEEIEKRKELETRVDSMESKLDQILELLGEKNNG